MKKKLHVIRNKISSLIHCTICNDSTHTQIHKQHVNKKEFFTQTKTTTARRLIMTRTLVHGNTTDDE